MIGHETAHNFVLEWYTYRSIVTFTVKLRLTLEVHLSQKAAEYMCELCSAT